MLIKQPALADETLGHTDYTYYVEQFKELLGVRGVPGSLHGPFEPGHVAQVGQLTARGKRAQEPGKACPVLEQTRPGRRLGADVAIGGIVEEPLVHQPPYHGKGFPKTHGQRGEHVMPVDLEPPLRSQAVGHDPGGRRGVVPLQQGGPQLSLQLTQRHSHHRPETPRDAR